MEYVGRFAPSPTGPLHAGSLLAALASFLDARSARGRWLLRIDDIDPPREVSGSVGWIEQTLAAHGLHPDGTCDFQSSHREAYDAALQTLVQGGHLFHCYCTRTTLGAHGCCIRDCAGQSDPARQDGRQGASLRVKVPKDTIITFDDVILGRQTFALGATLSDFIVKRRDGLYAYQLAAAVDDAAPGISHVMRGKDLLDSTPRQQFLQRCLSLESPQYGHLPVLTDSHGVKLSKQTGAMAVDNNNPAGNIREALKQLGQAIPPMDLTSVEDLLSFATRHWRRERIPK